jgi:HD-GYP domain-containing protein (c-di-GMP phosphodiesterase class II)
MIEIPVKQLKSGDVLAKAIVSPNGVILLDAGTVLTDAYIRRLRMHKIQRVFVSPGDSLHPQGQQGQSASSKNPMDEWVLPDIARMKENDQSRKQAVKAAESFADKMQGLAKIKLPVPEEAFRKQFRDMIGSIVSNRAFAEELSVILQTDKLLFQHALQVSMCSSIIGAVRQMDPDRLYELLLGALFSDIGMTRLPSDLTKVTRELTDVERQRVRGHTTEGYRILGKMKDVPESSAKVALQHHERYHGDGYPYGLKKNEISEFAQIVGIADVFNALLSSRYHRKAYAIEEAMEYLFAAGNFEFDLSLILTYLQHLTFYPVGTHVLMNNGQIGYVVETANRPALRPVVQIYREADGSAIASPYLIDLEQHPYLAILKRVKS